MPWGAIITVAIQLLGWFLDRAKIKNELMREFYAWAEKLGNDIGSAKLRDAAQRQLDWLDKNPWKPS